MQGKPPNRNFDEIKDRTRRIGASRFLNWLSDSQMAASSWFYKLIPPQLQPFLPFIRNELGIEAPTLEQIKDRILQKRREKEAELELRGDAARALAQKNNFLYPRYKCLSGNPLNCEFSRTIEPGEIASYSCLECGFPAPLALETQIRGNRGTYEVTGILGDRGMGRLYQAIQLADNQPVIIKEYLLPDRYFNQSEAKVRQDTFVNLGGLNLADGRMQDFRLITPWEAIADVQDHRCYLIIRNSYYTAPTLASYIQQTGRMSNREVRLVLNQVLQSLESLHCQKYSLPSGLIQQGFPHGNLNLDSLLIVPNFQGFMIYLTDLALWEQRFNLPISIPPINSITQDLKDLGCIAFYLLTGQLIEPGTNQELTAKKDEYWLGVHPPLKYFILSLMGIGPVQYQNAPAARTALLKLPLEPLEIEQGKAQPRSDEENKPKSPWRIVYILLIVLALILLGWLLWFLISGRQVSTADQPLTCCIEQVSRIPSGKFTYTAEQNGTWSYILNQQNLIAKGETLSSELATRQPRLKLNYLPEPSSAAAIAKVVSEDVDFGITSLYSNLSDNLGYQKFAYDGLVVFVNFSYARRSNSLPHALKGQISFKNLREIFTGKINNWQQLGGPDLPIKIYLPLDGEAVRIFEQRVLKDDISINSFRKLILPANQFNNSFVNSGQITRLGTFETFRQIIGDFENNNIGSISFSTLSKVLGQCSVYPLAITSGKTAPISPLVLDNQQSVTPETDLCNNKGSYKPNLDAFISQKYPLAYPMAVIYPRDNRREPAGEKFAEILKTIEAQRLLQKTGLVPLQALPIRELTD